MHISTLFPSLLLTLSFSSIARAYQAEDIYQRDAVSSDYFDALFAREASPDAYYTDLKARSDTLEVREQELVARELAIEGQLTNQKRGLEPRWQLHCAKKGCRSQPCIHATHPNDHWFCPNCMGTCHV
ncbi:hypothetical protein MMC19_007673 [Ptychographa xylographoides]|nr:hypothetical protein [Ptychographa xylographoides]